MDLETTLDEADWLAIAERGAWSKVRDEQVAAAFQDMRRSAGELLVNALHKEVTSRLLRFVRREVGHHLYDRGWEAVDFAMDKLVDALLDEQSPDGMALRTHFGQTVKSRAMDGVRKSIVRHAREASLDVETVARNAVAPATQEETVDIFKALAALSDPQERLAYVLHLMEFPVEGEDSICVALGVSRPTAKRIVAKAKSRVKAALRSKPQLWRGP